MNFKKSPPLHCDVRDYPQVQRSVQEVVKQAGRIDLLFVAAGVHLVANIEETSIDEFERVLSINAKGPFCVLKDVLPVMRKQRYGNVVLMGSDQVFIGKGSSAVYAIFVFVGLVLPTIVARLAGVAA